MKGHQEPRVYTQPLRPLTEETSLGYAFIAFCETVLEVDLLPWQEWLAIHALEIDDLGRFRFRTVVVLMGRQQGKTFFGKCLALFFMVVLDTKLTVGTAQNLDVAEEIWSAAVQMLEDNPKLRPLVARVKRTNGQKSLELTGGQRYRVVSSNRAGGRGISSDLILLDELREHTDWEAWGAITKSTMARPNAVVWCMSNAGDARSVVLRHLRTKAHGAAGDPDGVAAELGDALEVIDDEMDQDEATLGLFEWSAAPDCPINDREAWAASNPSLGYGFVTERALQSAMNTDPEDVFRTECLCQWIEAKITPPFPDGAWDMGIDPRSAIARGGEMFFGLDVSADRKRATLAVCGRRDDRLWHVEVLASKPGVGWVVQWLEGRAAAGPVKLALQGRGAPVSSYIDQLGNLEGVELVLIEGRDLGASAGRFYDAVMANADEGDAVAVMHRPQPILDEAAAVAKKRAVGDAAWCWDRTNSPCDISPLVAVTMAFGAASYTNTNDKQFKSAYTEGRGLLVI